jgi:hypothetical protein
MAFVVLFEACVYLCVYGMDMIVSYWYVAESYPVQAAI